MILEERRSGSEDYPDLGECVELLQRYSKLANMSKIGQTTRSRPVVIVRPRTHSVRRRLDSEARAQLIADYERGVPSTQFVTAYGLAKGTVLKILHETGVVRKQRHPSADEVDEMVGLYRQGWSLVRIGEHFGFDQGTVWLRLRRAGVPMRKARERR